MECLQIVDRARTTEIESVLADADIACVIPLALRDVGELVFDHRALSQHFAPSGCVDQFAEPLLELFVFRDGDGAPVAELGGGALRAQGTSIADVGIEFDHGAEREALNLSIRALDRAVADVEREGRLRVPGAPCRPSRTAWLRPRDDSPV